MPFIPPDFRSQYLTGFHGLFTVSQFISVLSVSLQYVTVFCDGISQTFNLPQFPPIV